MTLATHPPTLPWHYTNAQKCTFKSSDCIIIYILHPVALGRELLARNWRGDGLPPGRLSLLRSCRCTAGDVRQSDRAGAPQTGAHPLQGVRAAVLTGRCAAMI